MTLSRHHNQTLAQRAISFVIKYELKHGSRRVDDVQTIRGNNGYDLVSWRSVRRNIEVKGTTRRIPDSHSTEFKNGRLVATHLYVVQYSRSGRGNPKLFIILRNDIKPDDIRPLIRYRFTSAAQRRLISSAHALRSDGRGADGAKGAGSG